MSEFRMPNTETKAKFVLENFEKIASKYDRFNDWNSFYLHRVWKNKLVSEIQKLNPKRVMDLCCGTGDIALRIAKISGLEELHAVDFSPSMLSVAESRLGEAKKAGRFEKLKIQTLVGDAMNLVPFQDNSFDAVSIGFGLRNVKDLRITLREVRRVLKPGGIFLNLDVGKVKNPLIRFFANLYFFKIVPIFGYLLWGGKNEMFDYLPVSSLSYPGQEELKTILEEEGFESVSYKNFVFGNATLHKAQKSES
jgi:demethylmenaquinone methyltransferase/2-methoxy-6-polyprenyl-1,4-benzoquinol methylase